MSDPANRGKDAEKEVTKFLKEFDARNQDFDWARNYDAHSAGGRFHRQCGDFQFYLPTVHGVIEVKEVKHDTRLPHTNFNENSVAKLRKRSLAGGIIIIVVYHTTSKKWRHASFEQFLKREGGSWVVEGPLFNSAKELLETIFEG